MMKVFKKLKGKNVQKGFTLVELLVAISIFTIVLGASIGAILSMVDANRKAQALKTVMNNLNIAVDTISRDIVVARNLEISEGEIAGNCISHNNTRLDFNKHGEPVSYRLNIEDQDECIGFIEKGEGPDSSNLNWRPITAPEVRIRNLRFHSVEDGKNPPGPGWSSSQPKILILVEGNAGVKENVISEFRIQTTASQRTPEFVIDFVD